MLGMAHSHRESHCISLITIRFRPVSGFISAYQADWCLQFPALPTLGLLRFEQKFGVSLFGSLLRLGSEQ